MVQTLFNDLKTDIRRVIYLREIYIGLCTFILNITAYSFTLYRVGSVQILAYGNEYRDSRCR